MADDLDTLEDSPQAGHNSTRAAGINNKALKSIVDRVENLQCSIDELKDDQKEIFEEAKSQGFNVKIIRKVLRLRNQEKAEREAELAETELYMLALGML